MRRRLRVTYLRLLRWMSPKAEKERDLINSTVLETVSWWDKELTPEQQTLAIKRFVNKLTANKTQRVNQARQLLADANADMEHFLCIKSDF